MRLLIVFAALALPASSTAAPAPAPAPGNSPLRHIDTGPAKPDCKSAPNVHPADLGEAPKAQRLGDLPPGNVVLTVMREVDGCNEPVIVRYGTGAAAPAPVRPRRY